MNTNIYDKLSILNILYDTVDALSVNFALCTKGEMTYLVNAFGEEIIELASNKVTRVGNFLLVDDFNSRQHIIISGYTGEIKDIFKEKNKSYVFHFSGHYMGDNYIGVYFSDSFYIYDYKLDEVDKISDIYSIRTYKLNNECVGIYYRVYMDKYKAIFNSKIGKMMYLDIQELYTNIELVASERVKDGFSVNSNIKDIFKYKLNVCGITVTEKSYQDITKPLELNNTNLLYTHDYHNNSRCMGIIDIKGNELLPAIYSNISYIGSDYFLLEYNSDNKIYKEIFSVTMGKVYENRILNVTRHSTLPIVIVQLIDNQFIILDTTGRWFKPEEMSKYFKCMYSDEQNNIIKVDLGYGIKYITNNLIPITNIHEISKLATHKWIPM